MVKTEKQRILSKFISRQVEAIYEKYKNITKDEEAWIGSFIEKVEGAGIDFFDPYEDYQQTKTLAELLGDEENIDLIKLYIFLTVDLNLRVSLEEVQVYQEDLENKGYKQIGDYLFYFDYGIDSLEARVEEVLTYDLEDADKVVEYFDEEELANMWIFETSPEIVAKQLIVDEGWLDILDIEDLGIAYKDKYDCEIYYCLNEGSDIFEDN